MRINSKTYDFKTLVGFTGGLESLNVSCKHGKFMTTFKEKSQESAFEFRVTGREFLKQLSAAIESHVETFENRRPFLKELFFPSVTRLVLSSGRMICVETTRFSFKRLIAVRFIDKDPLFISPDPEWSMYLSTPRIALMFAKKLKIISELYGKVA